MKNKKLWGIAGGLLLLAFTVYVLLDTFVIPRVYTPTYSDNPSQTAGSDHDSAASPENDVDAVETPAALITENSYQDDNISIVITEYREYETNIYVADVQISSPEYLKTALAKGVFGHNITAKVSETAENVNAIFAVNGDYYSVRETGYVLRNGYLYRDTSSGREILVIYKDGSFSMFKEDEISADQLLADGAEQVLCFGPSLVRDGNISVSTQSETKNPRTAIGQIDDLHYLFAVTDGRVDDSEGLSYYEMAEFMQSLGAKEAYNLDGGGSSAMYFNGKLINDTLEGERKVSDIVYIGY